MFRFECDKAYELCGYRADERYTFPVEAYYKFCKKRGIPFPIDWRPKGESEDYLYTLAEATACLLDLGYWDTSILDAEAPFDVENDGFAAPKLLEILHTEIKQSNRGSCWVFNGYAWDNPVNAEPWWRARFPVCAYYRWWLKDSHGIKAPRWFSHLASDCLPPVPALPVKVVEDIGGEPEHTEIEPSEGYVIADDGFRYIGEPSTDYPTPPPKDAEVMDGLTVADLRKVFDHSPALRDVVAAVAEVQAMPRDGVQKPSAETIEAKIRLKAKKNGWGTADDGSLAKTQWTGLKTIVLGRGEVGRPKKEKQKENP